MISLANNNWGASEVGDSLSKQLFIKTSSRQSKKKRNRSNTQKQKSQIKITRNTANVGEDSMASLKNQLKAKKRRTSNSKIDKCFQYTTKTPTNKASQSKPKIKTTKQYSKSLKEKLSASNANGSLHLEQLHAETSKNSRIPSKSLQEMNQKTNKKQRNAVRTNGQPALNKKINLLNKQGSKRKMINFTFEENSKINVSKLGDLLRVKNRIPLVNKSQTLRVRMVAQLRASRFRFLNEELYKNDSTVSQQMFKEDPEAFKAYHDGYEQQVNQWPVNPLDVIIAAVKKMPNDWIIADFGCGVARLATSVTQKVHSIDLIAMNDSVTACDMAHTPLLIGGVNAVVFCLSLMGTNLNDYLTEANRVLKKDGILKIAEVESRFENIGEFVNLLASFGFKNTWKDLSHNLFYFMDFKKIADVSVKKQQLPQLSLKPCLYKKR